MPATTALPCLRLLTLFVLVVLASGPDAPALRLRIPLFLSLFIKIKQGRHSVEAGSVVQGERLEELQIETPGGARFLKDQVEEVKDDIVGKKTAVLHKLPDGSSPLLRNLSPGTTGQAL